MRGTMVALAAAMAVVSGQAEAAVYTFTPTVIGPSAGTNYTPVQAAFTISIADTAIQTGSFNYDYRYRYLSTDNPSQVVYQPSSTGDVQALQLFQANNGSISFAGSNGPSGSGSDYFQVNLTFATSGQITAGALTYGDDAFNIAVAGSSAIFNGAFGTGSQPQSSVAGNFTGGLANVPEPATLGLLGVSLVLVGARRRTRHAGVAMSNAE